MVQNAPLESKHSRKGTLVHGANVDNFYVAENTVFREMELHCLFDL